MGAPYRLRSPTAQGNVIFEQKNVEVPKDWSMTATNIVASQVSCTAPSAPPERETGVRQLVSPRRRDHPRLGPEAHGYFHTPEDGATFHDELVHILIRQYAAFNSPSLVQRRMRSHRAQLRRHELALERRSQQVEFGVTGYTTSAVLRLLHQLGERFARLHPNACQDRRHAL